MIKIFPMEEEILFLILNLKMWGFLHYMPGWRLTRPRSHHCLAVNGHSLVVAGGLSTSATVEMLQLDGTTWQGWQRLPDMQPRTGHACTVTAVGGQAALVVAGGETGSLLLDSVDLLILEGRTGWTKLPALLHPRAGHLLASLPGGLLLVASGHGPEDRLQLGVEQLAVGATNWSLAGPGLLSPRSQAAGTLVPSAFCPNT